MTPRDDAESLADRLQWALERGDGQLTQSELADRLDVSASAVSLWLNGKRTCPDDTVRRIARITRVEPGWLLTGEGSPEGDDGPARSAADPRADSEDEGDELEWGFKPGSAHEKNFGNPGVYATPQSVETLTRENGQNVLDQALRSDERVGLRFRIIELERSSERYDRFLGALGWSELSRHLEAVAESDISSKLGTKVRTGYRRIERGERLVLLAIDDFGTTGLYGDDFDSSKPFAALVRDTLNSQKREATAGGTYGIGSKVNFACSALSTAVFASRVAEGPGGSTRIMVKSDLPWHEVSSGDEVQPYEGPGWLGRMHDPDVELTASAWLPNDARFLDDLLVQRTPETVPEEIGEAEMSGTSILIVGFRDPDTEGLPNTAALAEKVASKMAENFWPAMMRDRLKVWVERYVNDERRPSIRKEVDPTDYVPALCDAWNRYVSGETEPRLREPGDVASRSITLEVPATKADGSAESHHERVRAECVLLVRLDDSDDEPELLNQVGYVRGRGMIVKYVRKRGLPLGARPFQATLLAGTLVGESEEQVAAEQFLRYAEPPAHDDWKYNQAVGDRYQSGGSARLQEMEQRLNEALRDLVRPLVPQGETGPSVLRNLLQLRTPTKEPTDQPSAKVFSAHGELVDGTWMVEAEVSVDPSPKVLEVTPRLGFEREDGPSVPVRWEALETETDAVSVDDGVFVLRPRTSRFKFTGTSDPESHPADPTKCAALLNVRIKERK